AGFRRPIIAFTAGDQKEIDALREAGCNGVLEKRIDERRLQAVLERFLEPTSSKGSGEDEAMAHLVARFLSGLGARQQRMTQAAATRNASVLESETHQIKG